MTKLEGFATSSWRMRWFLWSPVALMLGIGLFFTLDNDPPAWCGPVAVGLFALLMLVMTRFSLRMRMVPLLLISIGFTAAQLREEVVATPLLLQEVHNRVIDGTIDEIEPVEAKEKLVLSHLVIDGVALADTPQRVRVSFRHPDPRIKVGDRVRFTANLFPLPSPVMPRAYDFARHFYFRSIGGNGFAMRGLDIIQPAGESGWKIWLSNVRHVIGNKMREGMPGATGAVAAAMTVGETGPIPAEVKGYLRDSGLAHMLAIAGLHLGIVTGIVFYNVRLLFTLFPSVALRLPVKKIAALCALASGAVYLGLAGGPIPAQRAFIMVVFLFTGILLDRKAVTLRTLSLAAMVILLLFPESMFGPSFQMSFAATLAIVSVYEAYGRRLAGGRSHWSRTWMHVAGIIVTSLVATLATSPYVLYHFNRFAVLGLLSNMIVVPLATFVMMPGMVLSLLLMPFGLEWIGYIPLGFGTNIMIGVGQWVTQMPYALVRLPAPSDAGLMVCTLGLLWLCIVHGKIRLVGLPVMALGLLTIAGHVPVDVLVSGDARQVMLRLENGRYTALRGTGRSFNVQNWLRSEGQDQLVPLKETGIDCQDGVCIAQGGGHVVVVVKKPEDDATLMALCALRSDVLVAWRYLSSASCPGAAAVIGRNELEQHGPYAVWFSKNGGMRVAYTRQKNAHRLWQPTTKENEEEEL